MSKGKNPDKKQHETFSPTSATMAGAIFEVLTLNKEFARVTMDVVSAYPHGKEKEHVYVRMPNEFIDVVGYENVMDGFSQQDLKNELLLFSVVAGSECVWAQANGGQLAWRVRADLDNIAGSTFRDHTSTLRAVHVRLQEDKQFGTASCGWHSSCGEQVEL